MKLACKDISPETTCTYEVEGESGNEVATKMLVHARAEHAADIDGMPDRDVIQMFESKAHE